ncbi:uncharacterized protein BDW70DRAFT_132547 [Aspergillus foveolatus]|uniref:uncharacterized protein n=1 Tax=Aspergillus foveolatus TaxID=210207 RepID=UPI003CCE1935
MPELNGQYPLVFGSGSVGGSSLFVMNLRTFYIRSALGEALLCLPLCFCVRLGVGWVGANAGLNVDPCFMIKNVNATLLSRSSTSASFQLQHSST